MKTDSACAGSGGGSGGGTSESTTFVTSTIPLTTFETSTIQPLTTFPKGFCNITKDTMAYTDEQVSPLEFNDASVDLCCDRCASMASDCSIFIYVSNDGICLVFDAVNMTGVSYDTAVSIDVGFALF
jgi:hypothetical protein